MLVALARGTQPQREAASHARSSQQPASSVSLQTSPRIGLSKQKRHGCPANKDVL